VKAETWKVICRNKEWKIAGPRSISYFKLPGTRWEKEELRVDGIKDFFPLLK
jgi:hypothetical protein